jgi:hypothetical protein
VSHSSELVLVLASAALGSQVTVNTLTRFSIRGALLIAACVLNVALYDWGAK